MDWFRWMNDDSIDMAEPGAEKKLPGESLIRPFVTALGRGRIGFWPVISVPFTHSATTDVIPSKDCVPPNNVEAIRRFLHKLHGAFELRVKSKNAVLIETATQASSGARLIHIVRLDSSKHGENVSVHFRDSLPRGVRVYSPDATMPKLVVKEKMIALKKLQCYAVIECA
jgi:hypothetical protein